MPQVMNRTFETFSSLLSMHEMLGSVMGPINRVTDLLMVVDEAQAAWGELAPPPPPGEKLALK